MTGHERVTTILPPCPNCGAFEWQVQSSLSVVLTLDPAHGVRHVTVEPWPIKGEGDVTCARCLQKLLDWGRRFGGYHDERRPLWDWIHDVVPGCAVPPIPPNGAWTRLPLIPEPGEPGDEQRPGVGS